MSSDSNSSTEPKKRGRKAIDPKDKKRIYHILCPHCKQEFEFYHGKPELKPDPITTPEMDAKQKNRVYQQRFKEKQKQENQMNSIVSE